MMKLFRRSTRGADPARRRRITYAPVTFSEEEGVRYLHFGTEWVQGAMRLSQPFAIELEYARQMMAWMLFIHEPRDLVQLGLGAGALTKFCHRHFTGARVTAVELNPDVIRAARAMFKLAADDARLQVLEGDAFDYVRKVERHHSIDALQVDLYDASARGPVLDSQEFYEHCYECLRAPGVLSVNLFGDHPSFRYNMKTLGAAFHGRIVALPEVHEGNRVALAFKGPPLEVSFTELYARAAEVERITGLVARPWVSALKGSLAQPARRAPLRI